MALEIAAVPVLTGEVAAAFEEQANKAYRESMSRRNAPHSESYMRGLGMVKEIMANSKL